MTNIGEVRGLRAVVVVLLVAVAAFLYVGFRAGAQVGDAKPAMRPGLAARLAADREDGPGGPGAEAMRTARPEAGTIIYAYDVLRDHLVSFDASNPGTYLTDVEVTGLQTVNNDLEYLAGIDFRPSNGVLYALAKPSVFGRARVVVVNPVTGFVSPVNASTFIANTADLFAGIDIDPVGDRMREVGDRDLNRQLSLTDGTVAANDQPLKYAAGDVNFGADPNVVHIAYAWSGSGAATLYGVDSARNTLVRIGGPGGSLSPSTGELTTIGSLGIDPTSFGGMDIPTGSNTAYASLNLSSVPTLVTIDLATGAASVVGRIGDGTNTIDGLAIPTGAIVQPTPVPTPTSSPTPAPSPTPLFTPVPSPTATPTRSLGLGFAQAATTSATLPIQLRSLGSETTVSFTVLFDQNRLFNPFVSLHSQAAPASTVTTDVSQLSSGRLGVTISSPVAYAPGNYVIGDISFNVVRPADFGTLTIGLGDTPVQRGFFSASGASLPGTFIPGSILNSQTAAGVEVSGRVMTPDGRSLRNVAVRITDAAGTIRTATTSSFGYYKFEDVAAGGSYVISPVSKRYIFGSRLLSVTDALTGVDFVAQ